jgi:hypothetical protein
LAASVAPSALAGADGGEVFGDVPVGHPFFESVEWAVGAGVVEGYPDGSFDPAGAVSRQAVAAFLYRFAGSPEVVLPEVPSFGDVSADHAFFVEIEWLAVEGIAQGYPDGSFDPMGVVSRQAVAAFLERYAGSPEVLWPEASFVDVPEGHPFFDGVELLAAAEISTGYPDHTYQPGADVTRQAMVAFLDRYDTPWPEARPLTALTRWESVSVVEGGEAADVLDGEPVSMILGKTGSTTGFLGAAIACNSIEGSFTLDGDDFEYTPSGVTEKGCSASLHLQDEWLYAFLVAEDLDVRRIGDLLVFTSGITTITMADTGVHLFPAA